MADAKKWLAKDAQAILRHNDRSSPHTKFKENIDPSRSHLNYDLIDRNMTAYDYYWLRRQEVHCHHRADMKPLASWVITQPSDLEMQDQEAFFKACYTFIVDRYGNGSDRNFVQATVHLDETTPHIHVLFLPVVHDAQKGYDKICMSDTLNRDDLTTFHPDLQRYLRAEGFSCRVLTGVTKANGGNKTISQLKAETSIDQTHEVDRWSSVEVQHTVEVERGRWT